MANIVLNNFSGIIPRQSDTQLPEQNGQIAQNVKLQSGEVRPWRKPKLVHRCVLDAVQTIFRMDGNGSSVWLEFQTDTDVCYGPLYDQDEFRLYYSENGVCKKTNWALATEATGGAYPRNWLYMGVPYPETPLVAVATRTGEGDVENTQNRVYAYTYVSAFGAVEEEGPPSDGTPVVADYEGGYVTLSGFADPPTDHYNIVKIRVYRQVTGNEDSTYMLVDEIPLVDHKVSAGTMTLNGVVIGAGGTYRDEITTAGLGKEMDSLYFYPPPEGLRGLVSMPNGFLAGFVGNQIWFSEPYMPHAWPENYMLTTDSPIVGLGVYGSTLVVCTTRQPYTVTATHPSQATQEKLPMNQPCVSKRSIAYDQFGVLYASPYGLVAVSAGQIDVFTRELCTQTEWAEYVPATFVSNMYNNLYMAGYTSGPVREMLVLARADVPPMVTYEFDPVSLFVERGTGLIFGLKESDNNIYQLDADEVNAEVYTWKSKRFVFQYLTSFAAMKTDAEYSMVHAVEEWRKIFEEAKAYNRALWAKHHSHPLGFKGAVNTIEVDGVDVDGSLMKSLPTEPEDRYLKVTLIGDGEVVYEKEFDSIVSVRVPAVKAYAWEVRFEGNIDLISFSMSTTMRTLASPV